MIPAKATAIIFLCFSIVVAFANLLIDNLQHLIFIVPFALACILKDTKSRLLEIIGLYMVSVYLLCFATVIYGIMALVITAVFLIVFIKRRLFSRLYIYINTLLVCVVSFVKYGPEGNAAAHALLDAMLFAVGAISIYCALYRHDDERRLQNTPLKEKYLVTLEGLHKIAHESIDIIKHL